MSIAVGIDLGTTNSVVAFQKDEHGPLVLHIRQPQFERNKLDELDLIKSAVFFETQARSVVGAFASLRQDSFRSFKSQMGTRRSFHSELLRRTIRPYELSAHVLRLAFQTVKEFSHSWDGSAAITVPASFNTDQRGHTYLAAKMAGFQKVTLIEEPLAAFLYFFQQQREGNLFHSCRYVLVFDFGGGTLDTSVIKITDISKGDFTLDTIGRSRYNNLGGDDIDTELAAFFLACWEKSNCHLSDFDTTTRAKIFQLFRTRASEYKEEVEHYIGNGLPMPEFRVEAHILTTEQTELEIKFFRVIPEQLYRDIADRFCDPANVLNIHRPIAEAFQLAKEIDGEFSEQKLGLVLHTGGTSRMSGVQRSLEARFGKICFPVSSADEACHTVALGAAVYSYSRQQQRKSLTVTSRLLESIFTRDSRGRYHRIVPLNCEPSTLFTQVDGEFSLDDETIVLRLPLFRGVSETDHQLTPIQVVLVPLGTLFGAGEAYTLKYRQNEDKTVDLEVHFGSRCWQARIGLNEAAIREQAIPPFNFKVNQL